MPPAIRDNPIRRRQLGLASPGKDWALGATIVDTCPARANRINVSTIPHKGDAGDDTYIRQKSRQGPSEVFSIGRPTTNTLPASPHLVVTVSPPALFLEFGGGWQLYYAGTSYAGPACKCKSPAADHNKKLEECCGVLVPTNAPTCRKFFMSRHIVLTGAPTNLAWDEKALLSDAPVHAEVVTPSDASNTSSAKPLTAQRRQLPESLRMRPISLPKLDVETQATPNFDKTPTEFFSASDFSTPDQISTATSSNDSHTSDSSSDPPVGPLAQFYEHSFSIHDALPSSQLLEASDFAPGTPVYESNEEMFAEHETGNNGIIRTPSGRRLSQLPRPKHLTDLQDIPNAAYLASIEPQTMTVHLVVGVLSISPPRTVVSGKKFGRQRETELLEVLVGDDTRTDFSITMWLPREMHVNWKDGAKATPEGSRSALRRSLKNLRPRDVILLQNVALSSFRGKVHGQSLRRDVTRVDLLFRKKIDSEDLGGVYTVQSLRNATGSDPQLMKVKKVRDWLVTFVGGDQDRMRTRNGRFDRGPDYKGLHRVLPPNTQ